MKIILELLATQRALRLEAHEKHDKATGAELRDITVRVKGIGDRISALITAGAEPCEGFPGKPCGALPLGLVQEVAVNNEPHPYFEVGCLHCRGKRAQGFTPEEAVEKWNDERYLKPKNRDGKAAPAAAPDKGGK
jgi:hypothetical protein